MKLRVKRAHRPYPGIFLRVGDEITLEPDMMAAELVRRGFFAEVPVEEKPKKKTRGGE